jgi:L-asparaginase / beta-aspartyl-peptidase
MTLPPTEKTDRPASLAAGACVLAHGGAANEAAVVDGCEAACAAARGVLEAGGSALEAAVAAVVVLEDDPRMNAGTGSVIRLGEGAEGGGIQMDASVMDAGGFGAVAVVEGLKNPVKLARAVYDSPHRMIAGPGAMELAARLGLEPADPTTDRQRERYRARMARLDEDPRFRAMWSGVPDAFWRALEGAHERGGGACDTVGAVVRDGRGRFAVASSTGGIWCALRGRVGDVPISGAGWWVGPAGAVAATGVGEVIWQEMLSLRVHDAVAAGRAPQQAIDEALAQLRVRHPGQEVGLLAVSATAAGGGATGQMPWAAWVAPA